MVVTMERVIEKVVNFLHTAGHTLVRVDSVTQNGNWTVIASMGLGGHAKKKLILDNETGDVIGYEDYEPKKQ